MKHLRLGSTLFVFGAVLAVACSSSERSFVVGGGLPDATAPGPIFETPDASDASTPTLPTEPMNQCVATECAYPSATCPGDDGSLPTFRCGTDLANDKNNCGECGNTCDNGRAMTVACHQGKCRGTGCNDGYGDCNGIVDDGCEAYFREDPKNCGGCGIVCPAGVRCLNFYCGGCPPGRVTCGNDGCVDLNSNDKHCGACRFDCLKNQPDGGLPAPPPNMYYGCGGGTCGELKCVKDNNHTWANCNGDLTDGCEVDLAAPDPDHGRPFLDRNNCGACGNVCAAGKLCFAAAFNQPPACNCDDGLTRCDTTCVDLDNDPFNCGACGYHCDGAIPGTGTKNACVKGRCAIECAEGLADCNQNPLDGCEAKILSDPTNCGGCGIQCDIAAGQPCVNGQCLTKPCEGPMK